MILLRPDCLVFSTAKGESIPCSAHDVTVELMGQSTKWIDKDMVEHAAEAVLHYFKKEKGQTTVSVAEFSDALERVLRGLGLDVTSSTQSQTSVSLTDSATPRVVDKDLRELIAQTDLGCELVFFPRLRETVRRELDGRPTVLRYHGLRACVKQLTGAKRWSPHCQTLNDQIVEYLRHCLDSERAGSRCALVVT